MRFGSKTTGLGIGLQEKPDIFRNLSTPNWVSVARSYDDITHLLMNMEIAISITTEDLQIHPENEC